MLTGLRVQDFALFPELSLDFGPGLTAVTGETGAGKSLLVEALGIALGGRAESSIIPPDRQRSTLEAIFTLEPDDAARPWLEAHGLDGDPEVCYLRRMISRDGRGRAFVNDRPVTIQTLDELGRFWVDFHGQHEHQVLLASEGPRIFLDAFAGAEALARDVEESWSRAERLAREREDLARRLDQAERERDWRRHVLEELEDFGPSADDFVELDARIRRLHARERIEQALREVQSLLGEDGPSTRLWRARQILQALGHVDADLDVIAELLEQALIPLAEAERSLQRRATETFPEPEETERLLARHDRYHELARKHKTRPELLADTLETLQRSDTEDESLRARLERVTVEEQEARRNYEERATILGQRRREAARELLERIPSLLADLGMPHSRLSITFNPSEDGPHGRERVDFALSPHPSLPSQTLRKVASGGELSRLALAVHVAAADRPGPRRTLVFDEIDTGVGGRVAERVGRLLFRLGRRHQVLCITHLGTIAAWADQHIGVRRQETTSGLRTDIISLTGRDREAEIARMIGGSEDEAARKHARTLLARSRSDE